MSKLLILLFSSPMQFQNTSTAFNFAETAAHLGHEVAVFCDTDGIYNLLAGELLDEEKSAARVARLVEKGVQILACMESVRRRGINMQNLVRGVRKSSLAQLVELMEISDRIVAFKS